MAHTIISSTRVREEERKCLNFHSVFEISLEM